MTPDFLLVEPLLAERRHLCIAIVTETYPPDVNGVALTLKRIVDGLRARGHDVWLVRPAPGGDEGSKPSEKADGQSLDLLVRGIPIPMYPELKLGLPAKKALVRLWNHRRPDIVHIATEGPLGWSAIQAAKKLRLPVTSDFRTNFHAYSAFYGLNWLKTAIISYMRKFHNSTNCTMVPTNELRDSLANMGFERLEVIPRGIETGLFCPTKRSESLRQEWGASSDTVVLLSVGRLASEKNLEVAISTYEILRAEGHPVKLVFVGDGPQKSVLARRCPGALFCGVQKGESLAMHYASADIFLFPSLTETFGNVTIEAMASGLSVVAFNQAAARYLIEHGDNGLLVYSEDTPSFCDQVRRLVSKPEMRKKIGEAARQCSLKNGWDSVILKTEDVIRKVSQQSFLFQNLHRSELLKMKRQ